MRNIKKRVEKIEKQLNNDSANDPRVYYYPNSFAEGMHMGHMKEDELQEYLRNRRNRPSSEVCDSFDRLDSELKK